MNMQGLNEGDGPQSGQEGGWATIRPADISPAWEGLKGVRGRITSGVDWEFMAKEKGEEFLHLFGHILSYSLISILISWLMAKSLQQDLENRVSYINCMCKTINLCYWRILSASYFGT